ncbi:MAG: undecaprenyl/decaprenyl-phosphate alpha-N-acetylglucosaminyl 1-phosphate transferase [Chloroflexi bacterium]|nr:undecaprenyl/decaprenyl-phosphate alpha-N-acetylglucosaminyl 1-phosphate transferase [Chloroflexota bacterium]
MAFYLMLFVLSLVFGLVGTPLVRRFALRIGIVDAPNARKIHASPVPLLGGGAIYLAFMITLLALSYWALPFYILQLGAMVLGGSFMFIIGLLDDKWGLSPKVKLVAQFLATLWLIIAGVQIEALPNELLNIGATFLWVVLITNAINFLDNMDGLSAGVATIASAFFFLTAYLSGQWLVAAIGAALAGAAIGFVYHNFGIIKQRSAIFMGDSGSLFLGYLLAAIAIKLRFPSNTSFVTWMVPVLILGLPLFDISLVMISRLRRHISPLRGGRDHTSHRLVTLGLTKREAVLVIYMACGGLGVTALVVTGANILDGYLVGGLVAILALWSLIRLEHVPLLNTNPIVKGYSKNLKSPPPNQVATASPDTLVGPVESEQVK